MGTMSENEIELRPEIIDRVLGASELIVHRFESSQIPWAFFAGVAASAYGVQRPINDIDIIFAPHANEETQRIFCEFEVLNKPETRLALGDSQIELVSGELTYYSNGETYRFTFDSDMIGRRNKVRWGNTSYYFLSREDTIILKAILRREIEGSEFDATEIMTIARTAALDWEYMTFRAAACGAVNRVASVLKMIGAS